jgi:Zn-dependent protease with chaperone function
LTGRALPLALALQRMTAQPALLSGPSAIGLLFSAPPSAESGLRALLSTHPSTAYRIQRLYALAKHTGELPAP